MIAPGPPRDGRRPHRPAPVPRAAEAPAACRRSPVARRCGATCSSRPGSSASSLFTLAPMIASLAFTFTQHQRSTRRSRSRFVGLRNWQTLLGDGAGLGVARGHVPVRAVPAAVRSSILPFLLAIGLNSRNLKGPGAFRVLFFLPYVDPVRLGRPHLAGDAQPRDRLGERSSSGSWASRTRPTGSTTAR